MRRRRHRDVVGREDERLDEPLALGQQVGLRVEVVGVAGGRHLPREHEDVQQPERERAQRDQRQSAPEGGGQASHRPEV
jgi:hypothetical protein